MSKTIDTLLSAILLSGSLILFPGCNTKRGSVDLPDVRNANDSIAELNPKAESDEGKRALPDGVYPVAIRGNDVDATDDVTELNNIPVPGSDDASPQTIAILAKPLLLFRELSQFDFTFEQNECTEIGFDNNEQLKAYTRDHPGGRLAVVVAGSVVSHHKIREPITSARIRITCCTEGGGDHLYNHLSELKMVSRGTEATTKDDD